MGAKLDLLVGKNTLEMADFVKYMQVVESIWNFCKPHFLLSHVKYIIIFELETIQQVFIIILKYKSFVKFAKMFNLSIL